MSDHHDPELDLLAYADERLDDDPVRYAAFREFLRQRPEEASRAEDYRAQTRALRRRFGPRLAEPVPDRLYAVLDAPGGARARRRFATAAAFLLVAGVAGMSGWLVGQRGAPDLAAGQAWVDQSYRAFSSAAVPPDIGSASVAQNRPMGALSERLSLSLHAPDLSRLGYDLAQKGTFGAGEQEMVRLVYSAADGRRFALFLRPRWEARRGELKIAEENGVSLAYWLDGPLAAAVASDMPRQETLDIAEAVREAMRGMGNALRATDGGGKLSGDSVGGIAAAPPAAGSPPAEEPQPLLLPTDQPIRN